MAEYLAPGVYVEEFDSGVKAMEGVGTSTAGFVGLAARGPVVGRPVLLTSFADYKRRFGGYLSELEYGGYRYLPNSVEQFFANGGSTCYVMRVAPENGTKILMHFGDTVIPGVLNDGETAQALVKMLPYKVRVSRYSHDFCGIMDDPLPYKEEDVHHGWLNGDIDFATDANYFTILFEDEENSEQYGYQVNIGVITCELSKIAALEGSYEVLIELAE